MDIRSHSLSHHHHHHQRKASLSKNGVKDSKLFRMMSYVQSVGYLSVMGYCLYTLGLSRPLRDYSLLFLGLLLNYGFTLIDYLVDAYKRLPRHEKSLRKSMLNFAIWLASSGIFWGITLPFVPYLSLYAAMLLYVVAIGVSGLLLYLNLAYDDDDDDDDDDDIIDL